MKIRWIMDISNFSWVPSITTTAFFAVVLFLARNLITNRLTKSVQHEYDVKLEALRSQFRESEERFKADLHTKETEIVALRTGAMDVMASRQIYLDKRRLEAVDQILEAFTALNPARSLSATMSIYKFKEVAEKAEYDPKTREFFKAFGMGVDAKSLDINMYSKARPFVSPMVWATFSAFRAICLHAVVRWHVICYGLGSRDLTDNEAINNLIKSVLPHLGPYLDEHGPVCYNSLLEGLESKLMQEIDLMISGSESDKECIDKAANILKHANKINEDVTRCQAST